MSGVVVGSHDVTQHAGDAVQSSGVDAAALARFAEVVAQALPTLALSPADQQAAQALTDIAGDSLQRAWDSGDAITENQRGKCALDIATSKVTTSKVGLEITSRMFEVMGARAAAGPARIDRFWRNLRTHTLHDPVDYKIRELGDWVLNRQLPRPSFYS